MSTLEMGNYDYNAQLFHKHAERMQFTKSKSQNYVKKMPALTALKKTAPSKITNSTENTIIYSTWKVRQFSLNGSNHVGTKIHFILSTGTNSLTKAKI